jgi:hypothetical protein
MNHDTVAVLLGGLRTFTAGEIRRLTHAQVEEHVARLAAQLIEEYGQQTVRQFRYTAVPRGGLVVLGILAYVLDVPAARLLPATDDAPLVVVDDCSLTGLRFGEFLASLNAPRVIFAHLASHPALRDAIVEQEPNVIASFAATDLRDLAPDLYAEEEEYWAWRERWQARFAGRRYWIGLPEHILFPWSEPDRPYWNPLTEGVENGWRLGAPDRCLKNRAGLGLPLLADARRQWRSPDNLAYHLEAGGLTLVHLPSERVYGFTGVAVEMWRALAAYGDLEAVTRHVLALYEAEPERVRRDVLAFIRDLHAAALLEPVRDL